MRPAEVAGGAGLIHLVETRRAALGFCRLCVGSNFAPVEKAAPRVEADAEWIAAAHRIDLWSRVRRAGREEISFRYGDGTVRLRMHAQDFSAQIVRIGRGALGVPRRAAWTLVARAEAVRRERVHVVAGRNVEDALRIKRQ